MALEHGMRQRIRISVLKCCRDQHLIGQGHIVPVKFGISVHYWGVPVFGPSVDLAAEIIGAVVLRPLTRRHRPDPRDTASEVVGLVNDRTPCGFRDFHEPLGAEIGESGMGGVKVFDFRHRRCPSRFMVYSFIRTERRR